MGKETQNTELSTDKALHIADVVKRTLERKEAAYACVNMWYEKEYDSSTPDEVASMDKEAAELNAQIKVLRHILSEVGKL
jgi:hypothetical protein